jgi:heme/copper-type cytochrome/quinol oxidase subunit 2
MDPNPLLPSIPVLIAIVVGVVVLVSVIVIVILARRSRRRDAVPPSRESHNPGSGHHDEG